ncbi:hypothetical protein D4450_12815 [Salmonella enterica subsp. enterica]|nr:hypothetical protein [Salmonella enterica subsp. enterica]
MTRNTITGLPAMYDELVQIRETAQAISNELGFTVCE